MSQSGAVLTQHHWAEAFLEEVSGQGGRTRGEVIVDFGCGQHKHTGEGWTRHAELYPGNSMMNENMINV